MKLYHSRKTIKKMGEKQIIRLHRTYIWTISIFLILGGVLSILAIWELMSDSFTYSAPIVVLILWPWIMQSAFLARMKNEQV